MYLIQKLFLRPYYKMSLCPSVVSGDGRTPYFLLSPAVDAVLVDPIVDALPGAAAATISMDNGATPNTRVIHYMVNTTGGGLTANHYQCFLYGGGNNNGGIFDVYGGNNNYAMMSLNLGRPLDGGRVGTITGTGSPQNVVANSCNPASIVQFAYVGGAAAAGAAPVAAITNGVGFSTTLPAGAIYSYMVMG